MIQRFLSLLTLPAWSPLSRRVAASQGVITQRGRSSFTHPLHPQPALLVSTGRCASCSATAPTEPPVTLRQASASVLRASGGLAATEVSGWLLRHDGRVAVAWPRLTERLLPPPPFLPSASVRAGHLRTRLQPDVRLRRRGRLRSRHGKVPLLFGKDGTQM